MGNKQNKHRKKKRGGRLKPRKTLLTNTTPPEMGTTVANTSDTITASLTCTTTPAFQTGSVLPLSTQSMLKRKALTPDAGMGVFDENNRKRVSDCFVMMTRVNIKEMHSEVQKSNGRIELTCNEREDFGKEWILRELQIDSDGGDLKGICKEIKKEVPDYCDSGITEESFKLPPQIESEVPDEQQGSNGRDEDSHAEVSDVKTELMQLELQIDSSDGDIKGIDTTSKIEKEVEIEDTVDNFEEHSSTESIFTCALCSVQFPTNYLFNEHSLIHYPYSCAPCKKLFSTVEKLDLHYSSHNYPCRMCNKRFPDENLLSAHHLAVHYFPCLLCGRQFSDIDNLVAHFTLCHRYPCQLCSKYSPVEQSEIKEAMLAAHKIAHYTFFCKVCKTRFSTVERLNLHSCKGVYHCSLCKEQCETEEMLTSHQLTHHSYSCLECKTSFLTFTELNAHYLMYHPFLCEICNKRLTTLEKLNVHSLVHNCFTCMICKELFLTKQLLTEHKLTHHSSRVGKIISFSCVVCKKLFHGNKNLKIHIRNVHKTCKLCKIQFPTLETSNRHSLTHHTFTCQTCKASFQVREKLVQHEIANHWFSCKRERCKKKFPTLETLNTHSSVHSFTCKICKKSFHTSINLNAHVTKAHNSHSCEHCKKTFRTLETLNTHSSVHSFTCKICKKSFHTSINLNAHVTKAHNSHSCEHCKKTFRTLETLNTHSSVHSFTCKICKTSFDTNINLNAHVTEAHNSHSCEHCKKTFPTLETLHTHTLVHVTCTICEESFETEQLLIAHKFTHHSKKMFPTDDKLKANYLIYSRYPFSCEICKKKFPTYKQIKAHISTHNSDIIVNNCAKKGSFQNEEEVALSKLACGSFSCFICEELFFTEAELNNHCLAHSHENYPFSCKICGERFSTVAKLNIHTLAHNTCAMCKEQFPAKKMLATHIAFYCTVWKKFLSAEDLDRSFLCKLCENRFPSEEKLTEHYLTHFRCVLCEARFSSEAMLKAHRLVQHIFPCQHCEKRFPTREEINAHNSAH